MDSVLAIDSLGVLICECFTTGSGEVGLTSGKGWGSFSEEDDRLDDLAGDSVFVFWGLAVFLFSCGMLTFLGGCNVL